MNDIDTMDIIYYLRLLSKKAEKEKKYIDDVLWDSEFVVNT